jgi:hypothetical protein
MTTQLFETTFTIQNLFLAAIGEAVCIVKLLPNYVPQDNPLIRVLAETVLVNLGAYCVFWGLVYPYLLSPIRHFPTINVSLVCLFKIRT